MAREMYGRRGWVLHHNTTLWRGTHPVDNNAMPAFWNMGAAWLCQNLWEHYLFTQDRQVLERVYPLMKGAAEFLADWVVEDRTGHLVTAAGVSPENLFLYTGPDGKQRSAGVCMGPTMDLAITRGLFRNCIQDTEILNRDEDLRLELKQKLEKLLPCKVGKRGQLQEWPEDFEEQDPQHRHVSHSYGVYPDNQISERTPQLKRCCQKEPGDPRGTKVPDGREFGRFASGRGSGTGIMLTGWSVISFNPRNPLPGNMIGVE